MLRSNLAIFGTLWTSLLSGQTCHISGAKDFMVNYETYCDISTLVPRKIVRVNVPPAVLRCSEWRPNDPASYDVSIKGGGKLSVLRVQPTWVLVNLIDKTESAPLDPDKVMSSGPELELQVTLLDFTKISRKLESPVTPTGAAIQINRLQTPGGRGSVSAVIVDDVEDGKRSQTLVIRAEATDIRSISLKDASTAYVDSGEVARTTATRVGRQPS